MASPLGSARSPGAGLGHPWFQSFDEGTLHIVFPARASDEEILHFRDVSLAFWTKVEGKVCVLIDCRAVKLASPSQRKLFADYQKDHEPLFAEKMLGAAFVIDNALVRGLLTAIFWLRPPLYKHTITASEAESRRFLGALRGMPRSG